MAVQPLTKDNFEGTIGNNNIVIIDVTFVSCDTEAETELAGMFQIRSIPTTVIFREQIPIFSQPGMLPAEALDEVLGKVRELDMDEVRTMVEEQTAKA